MNDLRMSLRRSEAGMTLPELLVVVVILGILSAIAIPNFLGQRQKANNSQAQVTLRSALAAERSYYVDFQTYTTDEAALRAIEPNILWTGTDAAQTGAMAATGGTPAGSVVVLASWAKSENVYCIMNIAIDQTAAVNGQTLAGTYYVNTTGVSTAPASVSLTQCGSSGYDRDPAVGWD